LIANWLKGLKKSTGTSLSKTKILIATLTHWDPLLQAVMERVSQFEETELFMIRFRNPKSKNFLGQYPTLVVGRVEPLLAPRNLSDDLFIHAFGLIDSETLRGSEETGWLRAGFDIQQSKKGVTFGKGPMKLSDLPASLLSALDVFTMFYGVTDESLIIILGDPDFEKILEQTAGLRRLRPGAYRLR
jgi:hypothetical protein